MALEQCLFMFRLVVYCCLWILSFLCWIPLCIVLDIHWGYCLLYADTLGYGPLACCGYTITVPIIFSLFYAGYMVVSYTCKLGFYNREGYIEETLLEFVITIVMDGLAWIFMFVNAGIISAGFNDMCWNIFGTIERCSEGYLKDPVFDSDYLFFQRLKIAEVSSWLSWLLWLVQLLTGLIALRRSGVLPKSNISSTVSNIFPCQPHCTCSCRLQFKGHERQDSMPLASPTSPPAPAQKV